MQTEIIPPKPWRWTVCILDFKEFHQLQNVAIAMHCNLKLAAASRQWFWALITRPIMHQPVNFNKIGQCVVQSWTSQRSQHIFRPVL